MQKQARGSYNHKFREKSLSTEIFSEDFQSILNLQVRRPASAWFLHVSQVEITFIYLFILIILCTFLGTDDIQY